MATPIHSLQDLENGLAIPPGTHDTKATALGMLWKQFEDKETWQKLATAIGCMFEDVETYLGTVQAARVVATGDTDALDRIGELFGLPRGGLTDNDDYRAALRAAGIALTNSGTEPEIISIIEALEIAGFDLVMTELYPAAILVTAVEPLTSTQLALVVAVLKEAPAAGVGLNIEVIDEGTMAGFDAEPTDGDIVQGHFDTEPVEGVIAAEFSLFSSTTGV